MHSKLFTHRHGNRKFSERHSASAIISITQIALFILICASRVASVINTSFLVINTQFKSVCIKTASKYWE